MSLTLVSGARIDDRAVVSASRSIAEHVRLFSNGIAGFMPLSEVVDCWEVPPPSAA